MKDPLPLLPPELPSQMRTDYRGLGVNYIIALSLGSQN